MSSARPTTPKPPSPQPPRRGPASLLALACLLAAWGGSACIVAGHAGTLNGDALPNPVDDQTVDLAIDRQAFILGTAFDFRAARLVVSLEMLQKEPTADVGPDQRLDPTTAGTYLERRVYRLDVPALSVWNFDDGAGFGLGYPGVMPHRHSLDLWFRAGASDLDGDAGGFGGVALMYYRTGAVAVGLTADYWTEPASVRAIAAGGVNRTFAGDTDGWVIGFEVTLAAGEYALDILNTLLDIDEKVRSQARP